MQITFKLFATLMSYLPPGASKNAINIEVATGTTINQLIEKYQVPRSEVHLVLLNGLFITESDRDQAVKDGDTLAIWPPVAGG